MELLIKAKQLGKSYRRHQALTDVSFELRPGQVLGLLGHNGAGKSTLIKSILGSQNYDGQLSVFGLHPIKERVKIVRDLAYISDVAVLPGWMKVSQIIKYMAGTHLSFDQEKANLLLEETDINFSSRIKNLSKGMKVQLHLALVMATNVKVLILDEPTLGLDLIHREKFYRSLMTWFASGDRALIIASHELAEIEDLLTDILVLKKGRPVLQASVEELETRFISLTTTPEALENALALSPVYHKPRSNDHLFLFEDMSRESLKQFGKVTKTNLADIFIAKQLEVDA
ncbi:ABC transporter ATP-binding protein [uncultured Photobacterium sp.]|uniref:ABC transporter ATP-binding protein n=1 Tax=uncultured Photobacterium sp. TaxID=173973 RepID=UPI002614AFBB|nr:ABC transporter ATP-binding protein [uncultured Photobacterium sp.]